MRFVRNRRVVATIVAASCIAVPASASASAGMGPPTYKSDAAQSSGNARIWTGARFSYPPSGFNGSDIAQSGSTAKSTYPPSGFIGGDSPADRAGAARAPSTIEVVRPERTIVRDVDEALPLILSGSALLLVLAGLGTALIRTGMVPRFSRSD
jgi:hypothetical protein